VEKAIQTSVDLPESLELLMKKEKKSIEINPDFAELKRFLLTEI
jgi:threonine synthase